MKAYEGSGSTASRTANFTPQFYPSDSWVLGSQGQCGLFKKRKNKISCLCLESNHDSSVLQLIRPSMAPQPHLCPGLSHKTTPFFSVFCSVSSIFLFLGSVTCPSGRRHPIFFLVFPLVFYYDISH